VIVVVRQLHDWSPFQKGPTSTSLGKPKTASSRYHGASFVLGPWGARVLISELILLA